MTVFCTELIPSYSQDDHSGSHACYELSPTGRMHQQVDDRSRRTGEAVSAPSDTGQRLGQTPHRKRGKGDDVTLCMKEFCLFIA